MGRGIKQCLKCNASNGARSTYCKSCGNQFSIKRKGVVAPTRINRKVSSEKLIEDWTLLEPGDFIVVKGGPVYITFENKIPIKTPMGEKGLFKVYRVDKEGILAYPKGKKHECYGLHFIYMGNKRVSDTGTFLRPHKIKRAKLKVKE